MPERQPEIHFYATSAAPDELAREDLAFIVRDHWGIENGLHHVKDRTWLEDRHWVRNKKTGAVLTMLRSVACCLARKARVRGLKKEAYCPERIEFFNRHPRRALKLITQPLRL